MTTTESPRVTEFDHDPLTYVVIGCAMEVHRRLGPGLLESAYRRCLAYELQLKKIPFEVEAPAPIFYKGVDLDCAYRIDLLVDSGLVVELKSVESLMPIHQAQILTYMKIAEAPVGLLINFNVAKLRDGIKRFAL